jgi:hypothetical protein
MALSLRLKIGQRFFVDGEPVTLTAIPSEEEAQITLESGEVVDLIMAEEVEIFDDVYMSVGASHNLWEKACKIAVSAPRDIKVLRESLTTK